MNTHKLTWSHARTHLWNQPTQLIQQSPVLGKPTVHFLIHSETEVPNSWNRVALKAGTTLLLPVLYLNEKGR